ncbi:MAG: GPW/gp25 family protein [Burkholderiaceae bacterium]|nr:GPW/gp25 family protein [Zoogloeaceae bacterium]MCP5290925.1 GPW/gp25 family protein [Burkholderiaceae bacterium]
MIGTDAATGRALAGQDHLAQSIRDILTTPIGSQALARDYGSRLTDLLDAPLVPATIADAKAAILDALDRWEPRVQVLALRLVTAPSAAGRAVLDIYYRVLTDDGETVALEGVLL